MQNDNLISFPRQAWPSVGADCWLKKKNKKWHRTGCVERLHRRDLRFSVQSSSVVTRQSIEKWKPAPLLPVVYNVF